MDVVQIRLPGRELKDIDMRVRRGDYPSRSEAIRDMIRRAELFDVMNEFMGLVKDEGITLTQAPKAGANREKVYEEMFGK